MFISFLMTGTVNNLTHLQGHHKNIKTSEAFPAGIKIGFTPCDWCVSPPKFRSICLIHHDSSIHLKKVISNHYQARYLVHWHRSDKWRIRRWYSTYLPATRTRILCWRPGFSGCQPNPRPCTFSAAVTLNNNQPMHRGAFLWSWKGSNQELFANSQAGDPSLSPVLCIITPPHHWCELARS